MPKLIAGAHVSISKGFVNAMRFAVEKLKANALQIFLKSPRGGGKCKLTDVEAGEYRKFTKQHQVFTVVHCSYLLNFAKDLSKATWPLDNLIDDLKNGERLGVAGVVLHIGKHLELSREKGLSWVVKNIAKVLDITKDLKSAIILENTAGQGTELGMNFSELAKIYNGLKKNKRVKFCFDTCHAFAAGYDLRKPNSVKKVFTEFDKALGLKNLACIHFNDSTSDLGSRVDRHANLGKGKIGKVGLTVVAKLACKNSIPLIIETPEKGLESHSKDLVTLRGWLK